MTRGTTRNRLPPTHVIVVMAAAVLGRTLDPRFLPDLTSLSPETVSAALHSAVRAKLLESDNADRSRIRFRRAVMLEAVCDAIPSWEAAIMHGRAADILSAAAPPAPVQDRIRHLLAAGRASEAAPLCLHAAVDASRAGAFAEAASLYEHALPAVNDSTERGELLCERGRMLVASGVAADAVAALDEGVLILERARHPSTPNQLIALSGAYRHTGDQASALHAYQRGLIFLEGASPTPDLAMLHARLAMWHNADLDCEAALALADRALALSEELGAEHARAVALIARGAALCELGQCAEGIDVVDRGTAEATSSIRSDDFGAGLLVGAEQRVFAGRAAELRPMSDSLRTTNAGARGDLYAALIEALTGRALDDVHRTETAALAALRGADASCPGWLTDLGREYLAWVRLRQGRLDEAAELMADLEPRDNAWHRSWGPTRIELAMARGDGEKAAQHARALLSRTPSMVGQPSVAASVIRALLGVGAESEAAAYVEAALKRNRHPRTLQAAGALAAYRGDAEGARALCREADDCVSAAGGAATSADSQSRRVASEQLGDARFTTEHARSLTSREKEVLALVAGGMTDRQVASALSISIRTVRSHLDRIRNKTTFRRRAELTQLAMKLGLLEVGRSGASP